MTLTKNSPHAKRINLLIDKNQKLYIEELAHRARMDQQQVFYTIIDSYMQLHPLKKEDNHESILQVVR